MPRLMVSLPFVCSFERGCETLLGGRMELMSSMGGWGNLGLVFSRNFEIPQIGWFEYKTRWVGQQKQGGGVNKNRLQVTIQ